MTSTLTDTEREVVFVRHDRRERLLRAIRHTETRRRPSESRTLKALALATSLPQETVAILLDELTDEGLVTSSSATINGCIFSIWYSK